MSALGNQSYIFWDTHSGEVLRKVQVSAGIPAPGLENLFVSSYDDLNGFTLAVTRPDGSHLLDWPDGNGNRRGDGFPTRVFFTPNGRKAIVCSNAIFIVDLPTAKVTQTFEFAHTFNGNLAFFDVYEAALSPDGKSFAAVWGLGNDANLNVYDIQGNKVTLFKNFPLAIGDLWDAAIVMNDSAMIAALTTSEGQVIVVDLKSGNVIGAMALPKIDQWMGRSYLTISRDGKTIVAGGRNGPLCTWKVNGADQRCYRVQVAGRMALSPDGKQLAFQTSEGYVVLWSWL